jgi:cytochrome c-type biogenesis protein CcsB
LFWSLFACTVVLHLAVIGMGYSLISGSWPSPAKPPDKRIVVPYADGDWSAFRQWTVQEDGRNKPFDSFARETVRSITGQERFEANRMGAHPFKGHDPVALVVSWLMTYEPDRKRRAEVAEQTGCDWEQYPTILCTDQALREKVIKGLRSELTEEEKHSRHIAPADLRNSADFQDLYKEAINKKRRDDKEVLPPLEAKAYEVGHRLELYDRVREGSQFGIVALSSVNVWFPLAEVHKHLDDPKVWKETVLGWRAKYGASYEQKEDPPFPSAEAKQVLASYTALQEAYRSRDESRFTAAATSFFDTVGQVSSKFNPAYPDTTTTELELWYNRTVPFQKAWIYGLLASVALAGSLLTSRWLLPSRVLYIGGLLACAASLGWSIAGFSSRVWISGRPPISNMYESVIWVAFMCAVFGLVLELIYRQGIIGMAGALVSTLGFVLADQLPLTLDPKISPLVAVLRSNYWLIIHVITIVSSYAAFALAWGLGNLNLGMMLFVPQRGDLIKTMSQFCYRAIQIGVILLFLGTMLGGFWAAESWGRFWGWDPKEVWALIAFLCYIIPLHARYIGWVKDFGLAVCSVVCFAAIVMAWYGVNFVLAAGLHSYGFGGGDNAWMVWATLLNVDLVLSGALGYMHYRQTVPAVQ